MTNMKAEHRGKKKENLNWEIIKLQAEVGETTSRKAIKVVEAIKKKKGGASSTTTTGGDAEPDNTEEDAKAINESAEKLKKLKEIKISQKIYHAKKEIKKAFVKAKTFETQRLVKRLREAKKAVENGSTKAETQEETTEDTTPNQKKRKQELTQEDVNKFENELELTKKVDLDKLSQHAFMVKLTKHPILGTHTLMEPYVVAKAKKEDAETTEKSAQDATIQIIEERLTNAKTVREHMLKLWDELEYIVTGRRVDHQELKNKKRKGGEQQDDEKSKKLKASNDTKDEAEHDDNSEDEDEDMDQGQYTNISDISDSEHDDGYDSDGLPISSSNGQAATATSSMFIGSLNAGNSKADKKNKRDKNDWVDDKFDEIYGKSKKNRPGQRERRAKAERKFGKEANHVKKAEEETKIRAEKKAARKAKQEKFKAKDASTANAQRLPNRRVIGAGDGSASVLQPKKAPSGPDLNDPTLHPSWVAKQSEKAAMAAALSGAKSNKIVFDDSD
ncbi:hypothetical protein BG011_007692 [Mortierella polycephala]|uniref:Bud22 domain-containing protein n=1 Tax=Mortierella polycephala TaxID=41804 RepID=A0A9P6U8C2_9FUNG|nr:hypothetical protein BG011_007692 [Mortierella polycephala]